MVFEAGADRQICQTCGILHHIDTVSCPAVQQLVMWVDCVWHPAVHASRPCTLTANLYVHAVAGEACSTVHLTISRHCFSEARVTLFGGHSSAAEPALVTSHKGRQQTGQTNEAAGWVCLRPCECACGCAGLLPKMWRAGQLYWGEGSAVHER
jgi:hypothetical protein